MCGRLQAVKGLSTLQRWSEQPCVRPMSAAHRAAGHNALRGSGPGQKLAFIDALALVGCPDHRIDRFCITCCLPFPAITPRLLTRSRSSSLRLTGQRERFPVALACGHHRPSHARHLVGERDRRDLRRPPLEQLREPGAMFAAVDLGIADDGQRAGREQAAQIAVALLGDTAELLAPAARVLLRDEADPRREVAA